MNDEKIKQLEDRLAEVKRLKSVIMNYECALRNLEDEKRLRALELKLFTGNSAENTFPLMHEDRLYFITIYRRRLAESEQQLDRLLGGL